MPTKAQETAALVPAASSGLYEIEENLLALTDTEDAVPPELLAEFQMELARKDAAAIEKRDHVGGFLQHMYALVAMAKSEKARINERQKSVERCIERLEQYVVRTIRGMGTDAKGKLRKLEGNHFTLSAKNNPASMVITDGAEIPKAFKRVTVEMSAITWEMILACLKGGVLAEVVENDATPSYSIDNAAVKKALQAGEDVPGADLEMDNYSLQIK